jgi:hypothetical protein
MLRLGLRLLLVSIILCAIGWLSIAHWIFEVIRVTAIGCMALAFALLILDFIRTPDPTES